MASNKEDQVLKDLVTLLDLLTVPPIDSNHPGNASLVDSFDLRDTEEWQTAMSAYINDVITGETRRDVICHLLKATKSPSRNTRIISMMFFSELLCHPELLEKSTTMDLLLILLDKIHNKDEIEACLAIEALGNAAKGVPRKVERLKDIIFDNLSTRFNGQQQLKVSIQILKAMSKYVQLLKRSKLGSIFDKIASLCIDYLHSQSTVIQAYCIGLFTDLARSCDTNMCNYFSRHVKNCLPDLLVRIHCKDLQVKASAVAALVHCLPYIGCKNVKHLLGADGKGIHKIYQQVGQKEPALLVKMVIKSIDSLRYVEDVDAVLKHLGIIKDRLPYEDLYGTALRDVWLSLKMLRNAPRPLLKEASTRAVDILSTKWKSLETVKEGSLFKPPRPEPKNTGAEQRTIIIWETSV